MSWRQKENECLSITGGALPPRPPPKRRIARLDWSYTKEAKLWYALTERKFKCMICTLQPVYISIYDETGVPLHTHKETMTPTKAKRYVEKWIDWYNTKHPVIEPS